MTEIQMDATIKPKHIPPPIYLEDFQPGVLKPGSYSLEDISSVIIAHLRRTELTNIQLRGLARYKHEGSWNWGEPLNMVDMKKFFDIFNDVYFNGVLSAYCTLGTSKTDHEKQPWGAYSYVLPRGKGRDSRSQRDEARAYILFEEKVFVNAPFGPTYFVPWNLNYLVQEMLVSLFFLYHCSCEHGCDSKSNDRFRWRGFDIHWQAAAYTLEEASRRSDLLGIRSDLYRICGKTLGRTPAVMEILEDLELSTGELKSGFIIDIFRSDVTKFSERHAEWINWRPGKFFDANVCISWQKLD